jgi:hypothetical protein
MLMLLPSWSIRGCPRLSTVIWGYPRRFFSDNSGSQLPVSAFPLSPAFRFSGRVF